MAQFSGVVATISSFPYNGKNLYSFTLANQPRTYFRTGDKYPKAEQGDYITFIANEGKNGSYNVDNKTVEKKTAPAEAVGVGAALGHPVVRGTSSSYPTRDERQATQLRIERQSCRNSALEFIKILFANAEFKLPAKNKVEALEALLNHYQEEFIKNNSGDTSADARDDSTEAPE